MVNMVSGMSKVDNSYQYTTDNSYYYPLADILDLEKEMRDLESEIEKDHDPGLIARYGELQDEFHHKEGYSFEAKAKEILNGLGFKPEDNHRAVKEFSGGWIMRISLARLLLKNPSVMLLDEPTNHLDMETLVWLENFLSSYSGTIVMVSHDRYFMDRLSNEVLELANKKITSYSGNYSFYETKKESEKQTLEEQKKAQDKKIKKTEEFIERFRYKNTKAKQVQSRVKQLEKIDKIDIESEDESVTGFNIGINNGKSAGQTIFHCHIHLIPRRQGDVDDPKGIQLTSETFITGKAFNISAYAILIILVVLYTVFW